MTTQQQRNVQRQQPRRFAADTKVPVERTRAELERLVRAHGASAFGVLSDDRGSVIVYCLGGRHIKHTVKARDQRTKAATEQEQRRAWRALLLIVKAKLEVIASGDSTVEKEFLADTVLADGSTVYEQVGAGIAKSYLEGGMPPLGLLGPGGAP